MIFFHRICLILPPGPKCSFPTSRTGSTLRYDSSSTDDLTMSSGPGGVRKNPASTVQAARRRRPPSPGAISPLSF